jgi:hypothetical protein
MEVRPQPRYDRVPRPGSVPQTAPRSALRGNEALHEGNERGPLSPCAIRRRRGSASRSRHFERATMFVKWAVMRLMVICYLIGTKFMIADIFTKATDDSIMKTMTGIMCNSEEPRVAAALPYTMVHTMQRLLGW